MGIPPERNHLVDFQGTGPTGASRAGLQGAILHLGQEVLGEGAAHVVVATILVRQLEEPAAGDIHVVVRSIAMVIGWLAGFGVTSGSLWGPHT